MSLRQKSLRIYRGGAGSAEEMQRFSPELLRVSAVKFSFFSRVIDKGKLVRIFFGYTVLVNEMVKSKKCHFCCCG